MEPGGYSRARWHRTFTVERLKHHPGSRCIMTTRGHFYLYTARLASGPLKFFRTSVLPIEWNYRAKRGTRRLEILSEVRHPPALLHSLAGIFSPDPEGGRVCLLRRRAIRRPWLAKPESDQNPLRNALAHHTGSSPRPLHRSYADPCGRDLRLRGLAPEAS